MVVLDRLHQLGVHALVQFRARTHIRIDPKVRRNLAGTSCLLAALGLGWLADQASNRSVFERWLKGSRPSPTLVARSFLTHGFRPIEKAASRHTIMRTAPAQLDEPGAIWQTRDSNWVLLFGEQATLFGTESSPTPKREDWERVGLGWPAFETALERLAGRKIAEPAPQAIKAKKHRVKRDPLELIY